MGVTNIVWLKNNLQDQRPWEVRADSLKVLTYSCLAVHTAAIVVNCERNGIAEYNWRIMSRDVYKLLLLIIKYLIS